MERRTHGPAKGIASAKAAPLTVGGARARISTVISQREKAEAHATTLLFPCFRWLARQFSWMWISEKIIVAIFSLSKTSVVSIAALVLRCTSTEYQVDVGRVSASQASAKIAVTMLTAICFTDTSAALSACHRVSVD